ncbi:glycoside hydrolase family 43 protein [Massilibacteroides sp.]|uniref:glycoside hydrolase family 43 protein n=1 Tax=Massilibacteroides sp. TaxID=2034766 RepID=UPI002618D166|nr:glycoside hydrolase family 43 protein [Massilibacteroides sp.]MDD4515551.1 glycoside hydrolase family 43 protein [Massilibacteroides sp.]
MNKQLKLIFIGLFSLSLYSSTFAQGYKNPVIPGFYPDPSICRVGEDYYLVTSSFEYFPAVPLFHSKDLINWKQIGHCLTRASQVNLENCGVSGGIYAPTIRYHNGTFYMITTNVSDKGNFFVYTKDPTGEWSDPIWIEQPGIDPSLYFENGKCYLTSNPDNTIYLCEIDIKTGKQLSESKAIWTGTGGRYPEAPHIYKKEDWYYLLISEGGTEYGHQVTIARSKKIEGPYISNPANPILTHTKVETQMSPIQGTGHVDFVQAHNGSWWVVFLAFRPQSGLHHLLGRETFLAPVRWDKNAWPVINGNGTVSLDMNVETLPQKPIDTSSCISDFEENNIGPEWNYLRNPHFENYSLVQKKGTLCLKPTIVSLDSIGSPTFIGRRQQHINFTAKTTVSLNNSKAGDEAGLTVFMSNQAHYDIFIKEATGKNKKSIVLRYRLGSLEHIETEISIPENQVYLQIKGSADYYTFYYSTDDKTYRPIGKMDTRYLSSETNGGFTGVYIGLFTTSKKKTSNASADFHWFEYSPEKDRF